MCGKDRNDSFRSNTSTILAICLMLTIIGLFVCLFAKAFLSGTLMRTSEQSLIRDTPEDAQPDQETPLPEPEKAGGGPVIIRKPGSLDWLNEAERAVASAVYYIETPRGSAGSGFMVAPNTLATAAHVVQENTSEETIRVYCIERDDGLFGPAAGRTLAIDPELDVALVDVDGCPETEPMTLARNAPDPNDMLYSLGYSRAAGINVIDADHRSRSYIPGADFAEGFRRRGRTTRPWTAMISPHVLGVTGVFEYGNSGGAVFVAGTGEVVGLICARDPYLIRSFIVPASSISEMLSRAGR